MWWVIVPAGVWLAKLIYDEVTSEKTKKHKDSSSGKRKRQVRPQVVFEERGDLEGRKVVVIGRTGAGKSSLINMLHGTPVLAVGPVLSTTRWIEGVRVDLGRADAVFVDTPGYGEIMTADDYASGLIHWVRQHKSEIGMVLLVIQADSKAHAEDKRILERIVRECPQARAVVVLSQVDKLLPVRQPLDGTGWSPKKRRATLKNKHIAEKIQEVCEQFGIESSSVAPAAADGSAFNRRKLLRLIAELLG